MNPDNPNQNRWYYWVKQYEIVWAAFPRLVQFLESRDRTLTIQGMLDIIRNEETRILFVLELCTITHVGRLLGNMCYELEGDRPLIFRTYELFQPMVHILNEETRPPQPVIDLLAQLCSTNGHIDNALFDERLAYCKSLLKPAREYLASQAVKPLVARSIHVAKVASMWHPFKARYMTLDDAMLRVLYFCYYLSF
jgi:hypothetical protein